MADDIQDKLHEGYLFVGAKKDVEGGFTLDFQKREKYYFVLWKQSEHIYELKGYKDENAFKGKRKSSTSALFKGRAGGRKSSITPSSIPAFMLTSAVKVHCMDMVIGRKKNHVIILIHGTYPYYFKTVKEKDIKGWQKALSRVAKDMEKRNTDRANNNTPKINIQPESPNQVKRRDHTYRVSEDSGRYSTDSLGSSRSSRSSQSSLEISMSDCSCPPSPRLIPTDIIVEYDETDQDYEDIDGDDEGAAAASDERGDTVEALPTGLKGRRELSKSIIVKRRERTNSSGEVTGRYGFEEAPDRVYDEFIRQSINFDDADGEDSKPPLPPKMRSRRSEPNLQIPPEFLSRRDGCPSETAESESPYRRCRRGTIATAGTVPPPLPARPPWPPQHGYENVSRQRSFGRTSSLQAECAPIYEQSGTPDKDIGYLMWEQEKQLDGIMVVFTKAELLDSLVLVTIDGKAWVAGWKKDLNAQLYGKLHVGDNIRQINDQVVQSAEEARENIRSTAKADIRLTLNRLTHAKILNLTRGSTDICWGIRIESNNKIKKVDEGPAQLGGLTQRSEGPHGKNTCQWIITEVGHRAVPIIKSGQNQDFVKEELDADQKELPIIVQPSDFIKKLADGFPKKHASQFY